MRSDIMTLDELQEDGIQPEPMAQAEFLAKILPAICRLAVEMEPMRPTFDDKCLILDRFRNLTRTNPFESLNFYQQEEAIYLAAILHEGLAMADEIHQLDGRPAIDFADGFLSAETLYPRAFYPRPVKDLILDIYKDRLAAPQQFPEMPSDFKQFETGFICRRDMIRCIRTDEEKKK